ncbi:MAG: M1 family aminopeptidase [Pyrinomonadaceae bacterium]
MRPLSSINSSARFLCLALALTLLMPHALLAQTTTTTAPQTQTLKPRPLPPTQYIPSRDYDVRHIKLDLRFDWEREQARGSATITFAPLSTDFWRVEFDAANMTFASVKLASGTPLRFETDAPREKLRVSLDRAYQPSDVLTVIINYHTNGRGADGERQVAFGRGLTFIKPTPDDPTRPRQIWSQGEAETNHLWFPCYDHPNDFATTEMIATVEKPLMVVSNGRLLETKGNKDNTRTFHWKMEQPHASYLTSIVVGEYAAVEESYQGIPVITYVYPNEVEEGKVTAARLDEMVKFFSEKTGVKYPYAKYAQTVARDFGGGMENITATTQTDHMIHDARTELDQTQDGLQSHELAHQWFGNYVTCRTWADLWLNEGFATYFEALWTEHHLGRDEFLYRDVKENQDSYYSTWKQGVRRPIVTNNYRNPDALFDAYSYPRAGAVLHMLHVTLGDEKWWRSLNHYLRKHAHQPVQTEQLRIAIEEATGEPLDWFFEEWVYKMGHPIFRVTKDYDPQAATLKLTIKQEQKPDPNYPYPQAALFRTPVDIEIGTQTSTRVERVMIEPKEEQTLTFKVDGQPLLVNFDYGSSLIKELSFDKPTDELIYQLTRDEDVMGRVWALDQLSNRMEASATSEAEKQRIVTVIAAALANDRFWGMRVEAATALGGAPGSAARTALLAAVKDRDARVRARAISSLASNNDPSHAEVYRQALNDQSYATIQAAALALGATRSPIAYDALNKLLDAPSWRDNIRASALVGLSVLRDRRALDAALRYAAPGNRAQVRVAAIRLLGATGKDDERAFPLVSGALNYAVATSNSSMRNAAAEALVGLGDQRGVELFDEVLKKLTSQGEQFSIRQFQKRLRDSARP